jgi:hypothetical protein
MGWGLGKTSGRRGRKNYAEDAKEDKKIKPKKTQKFTLEYHRRKTANP